MDENKPKHLMSIQRSKAIVIIASTLGSWSNDLRDVPLINHSDDCSQNRKDRSRCTCDIMAKDVENFKWCQQHELCHERPESTRSDSNNGCNLVIASRSLKKTKTPWGKRCMSCQPAKPCRHPNLFKQGMVYPRQGSYPRSCELKVR